MAILPLLNSLLLFPTNAFAAKVNSCKATVWTIENKNIEICYNEKLSSYFSKICFLNSCEAQKFKKQSATIQISSLEKEASQNPGSIFCKKLNGEVVIGRNLRGSEIAFCRASDGSLVDLVSLGNKLNEN